MASAAVPADTHILPVATPGQVSQILRNLFIWMTSDGTEACVHPGRTCHFTCRMLEIDHCIILRACMPHANIAEL